MEWKTFIGDRLIAYHPAGFHVIRPSELPDVQPLFCPICDRIMRSNYDEEAFKKFQCCDTCANKWVYPDVERWSTGWRPTPDEVRNKFEDVPI